MVMEGDWDPGLYLSVLIWATCGYEYAGFLIGKHHNIVYSSYTVILVIDFDL